nr:MULTISPECIES: hypothetical protein [Frankia]
MGHNEDALTALGHAEMRAVQHLPLAVIPSGIQTVEDGPERPPAIMREKPADIFKEKVRRPVVAGQPQDFKEQGASQVREPAPLSGEAEGLAGEAGADEVMRGDFSGSDVPEVAAVNLPSKVMVVHVGGLGVPFVRPDDFMPGSFEAEPEATDPGEQLNNSHEPKSIPKTAG